MRLRATAPPVAALALIVVSAFLPDPRERPREPRSVPVSQTAYACPSDVHVAAGQVAPAASVRALGLPGDHHVRALEKPDRWRLTTTTRPTVVQQFGRGSGGAAFFSTTADQAGGGGLMVAACPPTVDESWFVGLGSGAKHESRLVFTNLSTVIAVADVTLWGDSGAIDAVGANGIVIKPGSTKTIDLSKLAAGEPDLAVRIERRRGAFAVTAFDGSRRVFGGSEVQTPTLAPRRNQVIGGIPAGARNRSLLVVNPSPATSRVSVTVLGPHGAYSPKGLEAVRVPAGRMSTLDLPVGVGNDGFSLRLKSEQRIAAVALVAEGKADYAFVGTAHRLGGPALVPVDLGAGTARPRLTLAAPRDRAKVEVIGYDARMKRLASSDVNIPALTTVSVSLNSLTGSDLLAYVVVKPTGDVVGSATFHKDDGIATTPLEEAPIRVLGPDVRYVG